MNALIALMAVTSTGTGVSIGVGASHAYIGAHVELAIAIGHAELRDRLRDNKLENVVTLVAPSLTIGWRAYVGPVYFDVGLGPTLLIKFERATNSFDQLEGEVELAPMLDLEAAAGVSF